MPLEAITCFVCFYVLKYIILFSDGDVVGVKKATAVLSKFR